MNVDYNDERFAKVEEEKQNELNKYNDAYNSLIEERKNLTQQQQEYVDKWQQTQEQLANDNLQHQLELYNQEKEKSEKDFQREASASYADYLKEVDKYGVSRENVASNGLSNSGYAESSKVDMYNTYQNRLASARRSMNDAVLEFNNAIKEAQLSNNATLAQNALEALKQKLGIALEDFNYRDTQTQNKLTWENNLNNQYYDRYKDVESQLNYENEQREAIRQFNEQMARQKEQDKLEQQRWEQEMAFQKQQFEYQKQQNAISNYQSLYSGNSSSSNYGSLTNSNSTSSNSAYNSAKNYSNSVAQAAKAAASAAKGGSNYVSPTSKITPKIKSTPGGISSWAQNEFFNKNIIKGTSYGEFEKKFNSALDSGKISEREADIIYKWWFEG